MSNITLKKAVLSDAEKFTAMSVRAFETDVEVGGNVGFGPPCFDSVPWHSDIIKLGIVYNVFLDNEVIGGAILTPDDDEPTALNVARIFIDPKFMRHGYGKELMQRIENTFCDVTAWKLDTPVWNRRTTNFYEGLGYKRVSENEYLIFYRKDNIAR